MTNLISRFSNEHIGRKNAVNEAPRLQSQRARNDTKRAVAVRQLGRIIAASTGKSSFFSNFFSFCIYDFVTFQSPSQSQNIDREALIVRMAGFEVSWRFHFSLSASREKKDFINVSLEFSHSLEFHNWSMERNCSCNILAWASAWREERKSCEIELFMFVARSFSLQSRSPSLLFQWTVNHRSSFLKTLINWC